MEFLNSLLILFRTKFREPLELIWNLSFPALFIVLLNFRDFGTPLSIDDFFNKVSVFMGWSVCLSSVYGVGMLCVFWREQGLLRVFIQSKKSRLLLVLLLLSYQFLANIFVAALMMIVSIVMFELELEGQTATLILSCAIAGSLVSWGSLALSTVKIRAQALSTGITVASIFFVWIAPQLQSWRYSAILNTFNPIYFLVASQKATLYPIAFSDPSFVLHAIFLVILGGYGLRRIQKVTVGQR